MKCEMSMKSDFLSVKLELWSVKTDVWNYEVWSKKRGLWIVDSEECTVTFGV